MIRGLQLPADAFFEFAKYALAERRMVVALKEREEFKDQAQRPTRWCHQVSPAQRPTSRGPIDARVIFCVDLIANLIEQRSLRRLRLAAVEDRHRHLDVAGMAVELGWMDRKRFRYGPQLRHQGRYAAPVVESEERQPELAPARDRQDAFAADELLCGSEQRVGGLYAEQSGCDVHQCRHEEVRGRKFV